MWKLSRSVSHIPVRWLRSSRRQVKLTPPGGQSGGANGGAGMELSARRLLRPICFTMGFGAVSFAGSSIWQYENMNRFASKLQSDNWKKVPWHQKAFGPRQQMFAFWSGLSDGHKMALTLAALNGAVFLAWRVPSWEAVMVKWFCCNPANRAVCIPMVLSTFSHYNFLHMAVNMYVLWSFSDATVNMLGKEQFVAFYLTAGCVSSLTSVIYKTVLGRAGMSLGASGAIMGMLGAVCSQYPDALLSIVFLPSFTFSADHAMKAIIAFDAVGAVLRWAIFDHAAHLGGILFGVWYVKYGNDWIWKRREPIMSFYHRVRRKVFPPS